MAIWNRPKAPKVLQEGYKQEQLDLNSLSGLPYFQFASQMTLLRGQSNFGVTTSVKSAMLSDPIISTIIDMWISDALTKDILTNKIFDIDITTTDTKVKEEHIQELIENIDYLLENSNLVSILDELLYGVITTGRTVIKMGYVDAYEDTKIKLFESNKSKLSEQLEKKEKLLEAPNYDAYENLEYRKNSKKVNRINGRYFFEILPQNIVPLNHKGITVMYLDLNNNNKVLNPKNITTFVNTRGNIKKLVLKDNPDDITTDIYEIPIGKSFIENAVTPWSMLNTTQDCTVLALMTRASIYRIFQIDVGAMSNKDTDNLVQDFKKRITTRESIDVRGQHYSSAQTQIPLGDSIFIPTRNGIGNISVQAIGGDLDIKTQGPLEYFREELLASLGIAKTLVYGDESGALINTSATRQDIRYLRKVQQFTAILSTGLENIFKDYLKMIGIDISKLSLKVRFAQLNSEDALNRLEYEQAKQDALDKVIVSLKNLGVSFEGGGYTKTRNELMTRYLDADLAALIEEDELAAPKEVPEETDTELEQSSGGTDFSEPKGPGSDGASAGDTGDELFVPDLDGGGTPQVEPTDATDTADDVPYSIG